MFWHLSLSLNSMRVGLLSKVLIFVGWMESFWNWMQTSQRHLELLSWREKEAVQSPVLHPWLCCKLCAYPKGEGPVSRCGRRGNQSGLFPVSGTHFLFVWLGKWVWKENWLQVLRNCLGWASTHSLLSSALLYLLLLLLVVVMVCVLIGVYDVCVCTCECGICVCMYVCRRAYDRSEDNPGYRPLLSTLFEVDLLFPLQGSQEPFFYHLESCILGLQINLLTLTLHWSYNPTQQSELCILE